MNSQEGEVALLRAQQHPQETLLIPAEVFPVTEEEKPRADAESFFYQVQTSNWLAPDHPHTCERVFEFEDSDEHRCGMLAELLIPSRPGADLRMDRLSNLAALGQLQRAFEASMFPLPEGIASVVWQATLTPHPEHPESFISLLVVAMHRRAVTVRDEEIASLNRRLEELKRK